MAWTVEWRPAAEAGLLIHYVTAARIGAAVRRFAATFEGDIERTPDDPHLLRLRVRGAVALLRVLPKTRTIHVLAVFVTP